MPTYSDDRYRPGDVDLADLATSEQTWSGTREAEYAKNADKDIQPRSF